MRNPNRIPIIIGYLVEWWLDKKTAEEIKEKWNGATDQRLFQLLSNYFNEEVYLKVENIVLQIIDPEDFYWWHWEEEDMIKWWDLPWTVMTNKEWDVLEEPQHKQLKDLTDEHLRAIAETQALSQKYFEAICILLDLSPVDVKLLEEIQIDLREQAKLDKIAWIHSIIDN